MTREEAIQAMKEAFKNTTNKLEYEKNIQDRLQLLAWLESCKNISESHPEICKKIDRLEDKTGLTLEKLQIRKFDKE